MEKIHKTAFMCIGRAVMFGAFAIACIMLSFSFDLALSLYAGAVLTLVMAEILILKALIMPWQNPKRTEVWTYLDARSRPSGPSGKAVFIAVLTDVYTQFARDSFAAACAFFAVSILLRAARYAA
jgi:hypothetical protein